MTPLSETMHLEDNSVPSAQDGVAYRIYDRRVVIIHPKDNKIITLNSTASALWSAMNDQDSVYKIACDLLDRFEVEKEQLVGDALRFFADMEHRGLVAIR